MFFDKFGGEQQNFFLMKKSFKGFNPLSTFSISLIFAINYMATSFYGLVKNLKKVAMMNQFIYHAYYSNDVYFVFCGIADSKHYTESIGDLYSAIYRAVENGNLSEAIDLLLKMESKDDDFRHYISALSGAINRFKTEHALGCINTEEYFRYATKYSKAVLELTDKVFNGKI